MMRSLVPWNTRAPRLLDSFRREMDQLFNQLLHEWDKSEQLPAFVPRANVAETDTHFEVTLDLPGLQPDQVSVELKENQLWVTGERKDQREESGKTYHHIERVWGQFRRVIPFPSPVNAEKVEAQYQDGVLTVLVPKDETARPRKIAVKKA